MDYDIFKSIKVNRENEIFCEVQHFYDDNERTSYVLERSKDDGSVATFLYKAHLNFIFLEKF